MDTFDDEAVRVALGGLPSELVAAFALVIAERMFPTLRAYSREASGTEAATVREALDRTWTVLDKGRWSEDQLEELADAVFACRPETEDADSPLASYALDAAAAAWEAIQVALTGETDHAIAAARYAFETAHLFVEEAEDLRPQVIADRRAILHRTAVVDELNLQQELARRLRENAVTAREAVALLRREFGHLEKSNIGLG